MPELVVVAIDEAPYTLGPSIGQLAKVQREDIERRRLQLPAYQIWLNVMADGGEDKIITIEVAGKHG